MRFCAERTVTMEKRKKRFGDRYDGYRVRSLSPMSYVSPFIMKTRNTSSNFFSGSVELGRIENYIKKKRREEGLTGFGFLHVILAAYVRMISQKPAMNRFIAGQRIYQAGEDIAICMMVKKSMELNAQESAIKVIFKPDDTADDIYRKLDEAVEEARKQGDSNLFDTVARVINYLPALLIRALISILEFMDYFGFMPKIIHKASPFHCSMFITNLGSLGIPPVYHHLYDFGTCPVFIAFGAKRTALEVQKDGSVEKHKYIDLKAVTDERIVDGFYYASAFKLIKRYVENPEELLTPPEKIYYDVD